MPPVSELLEGWEPTDIREHWDEYETIQPFRQISTGIERLVSIRRCEVCDTPIWLKFHSYSDIISEHRLTERCDCYTYDPDRPW